MDIMEEVVITKVEEHTSPDAEPSEWNVRALADWINLNFPLGIPEAEIVKAAESGTDEAVKGSIFEGMSPAQIATATFVSDSVRDAYQLKVSVESEDALHGIERFTILSAIDKLWQEHLYSMDGLRSSIGLRAYGQRDPLIEYKNEAFKIFDELMVNIKSEICHNIFRSASSLMAFQSFLSKLPQRTVHQDSNAFDNTPQPDPEKKASNLVNAANEAVTKTRATPVRTGPKVGRNDPCPCGSGKKFKQCCDKT